MVRTCITMNTSSHIEARRAQLMAAAELAETRKETKLILDEVARLDRYINSLDVSGRR